MKVFNKFRCLFLAVMLTASAANVFAQNVNVTGKVTDQSGEPVIGATVMLSSNQTVGTLTDLDGKYSISAPSNSSLIFSCVGYATQTIAIAGRNVIDVIFAEDSEFLEETVVIGYGVQKKSDVTGAIASVKAADLENRTSTDVAKALQGKAAGVQIINSSGAP